MTLPVAPAMSSARPAKVMRAASFPVQEQPGEHGHDDDGAGDQDGREPGEEESAKKLKAMPGLELCTR